ncbi:MAG: S41 family peptidase [Tepidibacter sp.]|uniref:S41 family peptidase n=1 Tax=Tepidibacter sp. TaxID=2529387 RepID=UPI0025E57E0F|nr:S41 family peptidase [Tepidibacter sp.]MCT4507712.1 S41 family peptidase [Tepidibacter sp.]MCT4585627.1 S41 family peptidase [Peptostreptococcaceae bacterium]
MKRLVKNILCTFLIFNLCLISVYANNSEEKEKVYSKKQVEEDIEFMIKKMEDVHPNLYFKVPKEEIKKDIDEKLKEIDKPINSIEVYRKFAPIISKLQDGHTSMLLPQDYIEKIKESNKILYMAVEVEGGKIYIKDTYRKEYQKHNGWMIESIDDKDSSKIYNEMSEYISGPLKPFKECCMENNFILNYYIDNELKDEYIIKIKKNTEEKVIKVEGISKEEADKINPKNKNNTEYYKYEKLNDNTGLITFDAFSDLDKFKVFLDRTFEEINKENINNLIVDLRGNGGGNSHLGDLLIEYIYDGNYTQANRSDIKISNEIIKYYSDLAKNEGATEEEIKELKDEYSKMIGQVYTQKSVASRYYLEKPKFKGDTYFLIGRNTFSSAVMLSSTVKDYKMGYLIGEETGGLATNYGDIYRFKLPNTGLNSFVSHKYFVRPNGLDTGRGVIPDYDIKYLGGMDPLDVALDIIKNKLGK